MKTKIVIPIVIAFLLLLVVTFVFSSGILSGNSSKQTSVNPELEKYRSQKIPEECRLPDYESSLEWWKQHLSHHKQTWYCLEYYGTNIEELNG